MKHFNDRFANNSYFSSVSWCALEYFFVAFDVFWCANVVNFMLNLQTTVLYTNIQRT